MPEGTRARYQVHPRACGGSAPGPGLWDSAHGPSPRVRGKPFHLKKKPLPHRSIPARAGETPSCRPLRHCSRVHPRACGGSAFQGRFSPFPHGPSPRVRGKPDRLRAVRTGCRSIPARAGEALARTSDPCFGAVHPRACGGNEQPRRPTFLFGGPSPRVRGKPNNSLLQVPISGSIPARAGEAP